MFVWCDDVIQTFVCFNLELWFDMYYFSLSPRDQCLCESYFFLYFRFFFVSFLSFPNDIEVCFIKYDRSEVPHFWLFIETIITALRASLFSVLLFLDLICLILLPHYSDHICNFGNRDNIWIGLSFLSPYIFIVHSIDLCV